jgi:hypothetical protein
MPVDPVGNCFGDRPGQAETRQLSDAPGWTIPTSGCEFSRSEATADGLFMSCSFQRSSPAGRGRKAVNPFDSGTTTLPGGQLVNRSPRLFSWVRSKLPRQPQPVPSIYQPEVAAGASYMPLIIPAPRPGTGRCHCTPPKGGTQMTSHIMTQAERMCLRSAATELRTEFRAIFGFGNRDHRVAAALAHAQACAGCPWQGGRRGVLGAAAGGRRRYTSANGGLRRRPRRGPAARAEIHGDPASRRHYL